jgi:hypothetical protein
MHLILDEERMVKRLQLWCSQMTYEDLQQLFRFLPSNPCQ